MIPNRTMATAANTIQNITPSRWQNIIDTWGGYGSNQTATPDMGTLIFNIAMQYPDLVGPMAYIVIFAMPFVMMWITQSDMVPASVVGIFFGMYITFYIGSNFMYVGILFMAIGCTTIVWSLAQKRG